MLCLASKAWLSEGKFDDALACLWQIHGVYLQEYVSSQLMIAESTGQCPFAPKTDM